MDGYIGGVKLENNVVSAEGGPDRVEHGLDWESNKK